MNKDFFGTVGNFNSNLVLDLYFFRSFDRYPHSLNKSQINLDSSSADNFGYVGQAIDQVSLIRPMTFLTNNNREHTTTEYPDSF